ncbi:MAG: histidinol dehydrogenase [Candidatus Methanomethyliaceae archaeon]|nr:histidinol dehydrogenase [Candidatus Methanomethyliaceae archaeon]
MSSSILRAVGEIIRDVRTRGNAAILAYTEKFDGVRLSEGGLRVDQGELERAYRAIPEALRRALSNSAQRIRMFQERQMLEGFSIETAPGIEVGVIFDPVQSAGFYIPGGRAAYPSTVLMTALPAKVAGVDRRVLFTPPGRNGEVPMTILAAAHLAGVDEVYRVGGAQAIAAMAYGTSTIGKVEKIVGPGNIYVTAAKMIVSSEVGVDMPAGPSEVLIYAEDTDRADWIAADIMAQAEHDPMARALLVTPNRTLAKKVKERVEREALSAPRRDILDKSLSKAVIIVAEDRGEGTVIINEVAPEHLELIGSGSEEVLSRVRNAGAVFIGDYTPVAIGDYAAGTNHVLPTMGWSKRASPLSVRDFLRAREYVRCTKGGLRAIGEDVRTLAVAEGLLNHARSIEVRLNQDETGGQKR